MNTTPIWPDLDIDQQAWELAKGQYPSGTPFALISKRAQEIKMELKGEK